MMLEASNPPACSDTRPETGFFRLGWQQKACTPLPNHATFQHALSRQARESARKDNSRRMPIQRRFPAEMRRLIRGRSEAIPHRGHTEPLQKALNTESQVSATWLFAKAIDHREQNAGVK